MRSPSHMTPVVVATFLASVSLVAAASTAASSDSSGVNWCSNTAAIVLTSCGSKCGEDQACAQYPSRASTTCSNAARNTCTVYDSSCTYQCLNVFNQIAGKWTLFVKEPKASDSFSSTDKTDKFPAAPIDSFADFQFSSDVKNIQITGFDSANVQKGSTKEVKLDDAIFEKARVAESLALSNIDLSKLPSNFLPLSVSTLVMENCQLSDVPTDVGNMPNLQTLNISKNTISDLPSADSKIVKSLQGLTYLNLASNELTSFEWALPSLLTLDLSNNKLTTFPTAVFNNTKLITLTMGGNTIQTVSLSASQLSFLKRLSEDSTLGIAAATGSCASGEREEKVLGSVVCVTDASVTPTPAPTTSGESSSKVVLIVAIAAGCVVIAIGFGLLWHRRSKKQSEFYVSVMEGNTGHNNTANNNNTNPTGNNSMTGQGRGSMFNRGRAPSNIQGGGGGRPSRADSGGSRQSLANRPSKQAPSVGSYAELGKHQEDLQRGSVAPSETMSLAVGGSRQRESAKINQNVVRIASHDITYTRTIAKGAFGEVWLAHLGRDLIAVKKLLTNDATSVGDFVAELNLLSSLSHPRVLALVGACWEDDFSDIQIVTEFMDSGDLLTVLRRSSPTELTWENGKATYCVQVCEAVYYLHSLQPALIHRDIKSRNILVDERKGAKLSDFGESRERTIQNTMTAGVGTARWVAPEIILGENYSELADIYSLGVLLTELDTHQIPFETLGLEEHMIVTQVAVGKLRPKVSESCPDVIRRLAHECLQFDPQLRPSAARVLQTLMASPLVRRLSTISDSE